jgi:hypothetical protein
MANITLEGIFTYHPKDPVSVFFEPLKTVVVLNDEKNNQRGTDPDGHPQDIDKRKDLIVPEISEGSDEVILYHPVLVMSEKNAILLKESAIGASMNMPFQIRIENQSIAIFPRGPLCDPVTGLSAYGTPPVQGPSPADLS